MYFLVKPFSVTNANYGVLGTVVQELAWALHRRMVKREVTSDWQCLKCSTPGSTQVEDLDPAPGTSQVEDLDPAPGTTQVDMDPLERTRLYDTSCQFLPDVSSIHDTPDRRNATYVIDHGEDVTNLVNTMFQAKWKSPPLQSIHHTLRTSVHLRLIR